MEMNTLKLMNKLWIAMEISTRINILVIQSHRNPNKLDTRKVVAKNEFFLLQIIDFLIFAFI